MDLKKPIKYMGGSIKFTFPAMNVKMQDGTVRSWDKSIKIVSGKTELKVGKSFFEKIWAMQGIQEVEEFIEDIE